jgi:hypothetical protein
MDPHAWETRIEPGMARLLIVIAVSACMTLAACGGSGESSTSTISQLPVKSTISQLPVKPGRSAAVQLEGQQLRRCPQRTSTRRHPTGFVWHAEVGGIGCEAVGRFIFDRFLASRAQEQLSAQENQHVRIGPTACNIHPQRAGARVACAHDAAHFVFFLRP